MKIKFLTILSLTMLFCLAGCRGSSNTNTVLNTNTNTGVANTTTVATPMSTPMAASDPTAKAAVEAALKKKGLNDVTVEATMNEVTLRGTVPKGKISEAMMAATDAAKRKVNNQVSEK